MSYLFPLWVLTVLSEPDFMNTNLMMMMSPIELIVSAALLVVVIAVLFRCYDNRQQRLWRESVEEGLKLLSQSLPMKPPPVGPDVKHDLIAPTVPEPRPVTSTVIGKNESVPTPRLLAKLVFTSSRKSLPRAAELRALLWEFKDAGRLTYQWQKTRTSIHHIAAGGNPDMKSLLHCAYLSMLEERGISFTHKQLLQFNRELFKLAQTTTFTKN